MRVRSEIEENRKSRLRLRYSKTGKAKYISHLDLTSVMRRALLRAGITLSYSEGFNPHPYISVALPLQVGCGSVCELMDFEVEGFAADVNLLKELNAALPEGIEAYEIYPAGRKFNEIAWLELTGDFSYDNGIPQDAGERLTALFASESLVISKKTKRGTADVDIAPYISAAEFVSSHGDSETVQMRARVCAQNPTITPVDLLNALLQAGSGQASGFTAPNPALFTRIEVFDKNMDVFR